jgi:trk system potassium uptake protein TrkA
VIVLIVLVIGCGRVGSRLAEALEAEQQKVVVVDKDPEAFERLPAAFKGAKVQGDTLDRNVLIRAGIQEADAVACVTNSDSLNVTVALAARDKFKVPKQVIRVFDPDEAEGYRRLGIPTVSPNEWGASLIKDMICHPSIYERMTVGSGEVRIVELVAPRGMVGRPIEYLNVSEEILVVAITRQGKAMIPRAGILLQENDILTLACSSTSIGRLEELAV